MRALYTAATGMLAQELAVQVISHNIANLRTTGYKRQRAEFQDLLYDHLRRVGTQTSDQGNIVPVGLTLPANSTSIAVNQGGQVSVTVPGSTTPTIVGTLDMTRFVNTRGLQPIGDNLFVETPASGPAQDGVPNADGYGNIQQGNLE